MCFFCISRHSAWAQGSSLSSPQRRLFLRGGSAVAAASGLAVAAPTQAQVNVGKSSAWRQLIPADQIEEAATLQYNEMRTEARSKRLLRPASDPQLQQLQKIAERIIPHATRWNERARDWKWEISLIDSKDLNAFCMPGGKIAFFTGILDRLKLSPDESAVIMGHEMAHALREHARERLAKTSATNMGLSIASQLFGLGDLGQAAANIGTELLALRYSRSDETEADVVGLELSARGAFNPRASVSLWNKMIAANGSGNMAFLSSHPSGPNRIRQLQATIPKVENLYRQAGGRG